MLGVLLATLVGVQEGPPYERPPIRYSDTAPADSVARLQARLAAGQASLEREDAHGYLLAALRSLEIPLSSQSLVFSRTSLQSGRISARSPRAIYFSDDVYVGWIRGSDFLEIAAHDPQLGAVFYTLSQQPAAAPRFERQTRRCLSCHATLGFAQGVPGFVVRSVHPGPDGLPQSILPTFVVDASTPYRERWGGWYVTGAHGAMRHLGNVVFPDARAKDVSPLLEQGANLDRLPSRADAEAYPAATSDVVALLVLDHQAHVQNLITRANHETRAALAEGPPTEASKERIRAACDALVDGLLFRGEPPLPSPVRGSSTFAADFERRGPMDSEGRSLRQFDLRTRLFRHPCSYLVHSRAFAALPDSAKDRVAVRLRESLEAKTAPAAFAPLAEILRKTVPDLASRWK